MNQEQLFGKAGLHWLDICLTGRSCIDLGSGTGIVGIACAKLGANVLLTDIDHPDIIALLEKNAGQNLLPSKVSDGLTIVNTKSQVLPLEWNSPAVIPEEIQKLAPFELIVGADVVYSMETVVKLVDTIAALADKRSDIWIGHEHRDPRVSDHFLVLMKERGFKSKNVKRQAANPDDPDYIGDHVALYRFKLGK
ncbi:putative methyltransferase-domain-containing protein [Obelidium mucronatum]|nr:putative methyltransferase-domain-containing protein [Obelidium mucronatum]